MKYINTITGGGIFKIFFFLCLISAMGNVQARPEVGDLAPNFTASIYQGDDFILSEHNKPINLVFLNARCPVPYSPDCEKEILLLNDVQALDTEALWVAVIDGHYTDEATVNTFIKTFNISMPVIFDKGTSIFKLYQVYTTPYMIKLDGNHRIVNRIENIK